MQETIMITGGAGFIGSAVVRQYIAETDATIVNVDKLTSAGNLESLGEARFEERHVLEQADICDRSEIERVCREHRQGLKIACLEEIAYRAGYISRSELVALIHKMPQSSYREYLERLMTELNSGR